MNLPIVLSKPAIGTRRRSLPPDLDEKSGDDLEAGFNAERQRVGSALGGQGQME